MCSPLDMAQPLKQLWLDNNEMLLNQQPTNNNQQVLQQGFWLITLH